MYGISRRRKGTGLRPVDLTGPLNKQGGRGWAAVPRCGKLFQREYKEGGYMGGKRLETREVKDGGNGKEYETSICAGVVFGLNR